MMATLCLLAGIAALALAVRLPDQRLVLGLLAVVAGAGAVALAPRARRGGAAVTDPMPVTGELENTAVSGQPQGDAQDGGHPQGDAPLGGHHRGDAPDGGPWERAAQD